MSSSYRLVDLKGGLKLHVVPVSQDDVEGGLISAKSAFSCLTGIQKEYIKRQRWCVLMPCQTNFILFVLVRSLFLLGIQYVSKDSQENGVNTCYLYRSPWNFPSFHLN